MVNSKFKELLVAALLFECGDYQNQGQEILEAYTKDVNGHFAAYAHHILSSESTLPAPQISQNKDGIIWLQPSSKTLKEGDALSLLVISKRPEAQYQWRRDGEPIDGANSNRLNLPGFTIKDNGAKFDVVVKCPDGDVETSNPVNITVTARKAAPRKVGPGTRWASHEEWNSQKSGYEWLFPFIDTNSDGKVTQKEYTRFQAFKKKSSDWQADVRKGGLK